MKTDKLIKDHNISEISIGDSLGNSGILEKHYLTMEEIIRERKTRPEIKYLFAGVKEKSFGIVFGPSKSGKTIYCENLAMCLAVGRKEFLGDKLDGIPKKILFVSLEEYWENRVDRNMSQMESLNSEERKLAEQNYRFQKIDFSKYVITDDQWNSLIKVIVSSDAEIVIIDSLTRMNPGEIEKSKDAEHVMKQLRDVCYMNKITLIVIHHARKGIDQRLTFDSIKGSSVFAQETDFAIGVARTSKNDRYIKQVYYRYGKDDFEHVKSFRINNNVWIELISEEIEDMLLSNADRRYDNSKLNYLLDHINKDPSKTYSTSELKETFVAKGDLSRRTLNNHLKELEAFNLVKKVSRGKYQSLNNFSDEEE